MTQRVLFNNVSLIKKKKLIFQNFNFLFLPGKNVCFIGNSGVGKTSLLKMIKEETSYEGTIIKQGKCSVLYDASISSNLTIFEYLKYSSLSKSEHQMILQYLNLKNLSYSISKLSRFFQIKILLLEQILSKPKFLFLDDILFDFSLQDKKELLQILKQQNITLFYFTSNIDDVLLFPYLGVMGQNGILIEGETHLVLQEEKILKRLGYQLPFLIDLSLQLKSYGLIDQIYTNFKELTYALWK